MSRCEKPVVDHHDGDCTDHACHSANGLDDGESWRVVGLLHGGDEAAPWQQTVTTACHHCVDPACMAGCPVEAYEKDPITGIVSHLDDQCIGCRYCTLMCPYDVPKWSPSRGIVRKCDMCRPRLAAGEAPACVAACPNEAIRITVVAQETVIADNETGRFLPGAPDPAITQPTTTYPHFAKRTSFSEPIAPRARQPFRTVEPNDLYSFLSSNIYQLAIALRH